MTLGGWRGGRPPAYWDVHFQFQLENELSFPIGLSLRKEKCSGGECLAGAWPVPGFRWISLDLGIVWVSVTFGELLLHWAGSERRPGDGSSGAGHPETGARGARRVCVPPHCMSVQLLGKNQARLPLLALISPRPIGEKCASPGTPVAR